jgi:hypothetical protein
MWVETRLAKCLLEQRFMGPWRAGGHNNTINIVLGNHLTDVVLGVLRTRVEIVLSVNDMWEGSGIFSHTRHTHNRTDIYTTLTYENAYPGLFAGDIPFGWKLAFNS